MDTWPIWLPLVTLVLFFDVWISYLNRIYRSNLEWVFLEVRMPREVLKGPRIMEQVFASLFSVSAAPGDWYERYWIGETALWYSFEIVSIGGEIHFYIRAPTKYKNIVEAIIYSFYPEVEIMAVGDYTENMPGTTRELYAMGYNLWGSEIKLTKADGYPIRTYREFETMDEYSMVDPIAALMEVLSRLQPGEFVWLQFLISPAYSPQWRERGQQIINELKKKTRTAVVIGGTEHSMVDRSPGQVQIMKAIEENIAKSGFHTFIRVIYLGPVSNFNKDVANKGVMGALNQYSSQALNSFRHDYSKRTITGWYNWPHLFPKWRLEYRKQHVLRRFRERLMPWASSFGLFSHGGTVSQGVFVLNTEELATLYHFPTDLVLTAPIMRQVEAKKVGPPMGLPIYGAETTAEEKLPPGFTFK